MTRHTCGLLVALLSADLISVSVASQTLPTQDATGRPTFEVAVKDGRISLRAQRAPIEMVLEEIARQSGIAAHGTGRLNGLGLLVSIHVDDVLIEQALRQVVVDLDAFFFYGASGDQPASLKGVWVYPKGGGASFAPIPAAEWASTLELEQSLRDLDPEVRAEALESLVERKGEKSIDAVLEMLNDPDDYVRARALDVASTAGVEIPADRLRTLLGDPGEDVRRFALRGFAEHSDVSPDEARVMLEGLAHTDPSEAVRREAVDLLAVMSESEQRRQRRPRRHPALTN